MPSNQAPLVQITPIASVLAPKNAQSIRERHSKLMKSLRYYLQGAADQNPQYFLALRALDQANATHQGLRKDGVTPEFMHQLETALFLRTLRGSVMYPAQALAVQLLHDIAEDYDVSFESLEEKYGAQVAHGVRRMTKLYKGVKLSAEEYFENMLDCPLATLCKGADRIHNHQSMPGVFSQEKQHAYLEETERYILPMLKKARRLYPEQENAYENIKFVLKSQVELVRGMLELHAA